MRIYFIISLLIATWGATAKNAEIKNIATFTAQMEHHQGFVDFYWDNSNGKIYCTFITYNQVLALMT
jgi:hypothetical protein